jgi:hypothetical protein
MLPTWLVSNPDRFAPLPQLFGLLAPAGLDKGGEEGNSH